jgi:crossover junction endodeoxyribonuclease RuvC
MKTLGIDPGTALLGYGIVDGSDDIEMIDYGAIETHTSDSPGKRLEIIYDSLLDIISTFSPDEVAIEQLFFARNTTTALAVGQARGVAMLAAAKSDLPIFEYKPTEVKLAIAGHGGADKRQVQEMVKMILRLDQLPSPDDAADALAVAICHAFTAAFRKATAGAQS